MSSSNSSASSSGKRQETISGDVLLDNFNRRQSRDRSPLLFPPAVPPTLSNSGVIRSREASRDRGYGGSNGGSDDEDDLHQPLTSSQWLDGSQKGDQTDDNRSVTSDTPPLTHEHFLSPRALRKNIFGGWGAGTSSGGGIAPSNQQAVLSPLSFSPFDPSAWQRKRERDITLTSGTPSVNMSEDNDNLLTRLQIHTPRVVHFLQCIGLLPPLTGDHWIWKCIIAPIYVFVRLLVPYFFFNALLAFGFNVAESIRQAWFLEGTMFYVLVIAQLCVQIPYIYRVQRRIRNNRTKEPTTLWEERGGIGGSSGGGSSTNRDLYMTDDDDSLLDGERGGRGGHDLEGILTDNHNQLNQPTSRMNASLSEVCSGMIEVTAMNDFLSNGIGFFIIFFSWLVIICLIPQLLWDNVYVLSAYLIEITSISCLTVNLLIIGTDCRIVYHYINELCTMASYQKLTQDDILRVRKICKLRSRTYLITNNSVILLGVINIIWFIFRVFFTHWINRLSVVIWILVYFKDLIFLLIIFNESARVNERANQLNTILSSRIWHNGEVNSNLNRLSMFANLTNEPLGYVLGGRRWTTGDMVIYAGIIVLISLFVLIRSILMQFSLTIL